MTDDSHQPPDMDLIRRVQQARREHDAAAQPSQVGGVYWIEARDTSGSAPAPTPRTVQWCFETTVDRVDALWTQIKAATEAGKLGYKAKVATASRRSDDPDSRVMCVLVGDGGDRAEVERVREALAGLGIEAEALSLSPAQAT